MVDFHVCSRFPHHCLPATGNMQFRILPLLTIEENVSFPLELRGTPVKQARESAGHFLKQVGLGERYHKRLPAMLSGGEQQRVAIARALASNARIILADEPTGNLDSENSLVVVELLRKLAHEQGYCVIVVTHDLSIADMADEVLRLKGGELMGDDNVNQLHALASAVDKGFGE